MLCSLSAEYRYCWRTLLGICHAIVHWKRQSVDTKRKSSQRNSFSLCCLHSFWSKLCTKIIGPKTFEFHSGFLWQWTQRNTEKRKKAENKCIRNWRASIALQCEQIKKAHHWLLSLTNKLDENTHTNIHTATEVDTSITNFHDSIKFHFISFHFFSVYLL